MERSWMQICNSETKHKPARPVAKQIVHLIYVALHLSELIDRHIDVRILFAMRIEIHNDENDVVASGSHLAIKEDRVIIRVVKPQVIVKLKRAVFFPDFV